MSRPVRPGPFWLCGLLVGLFLKGTLVIAAETTWSTALFQLTFWDPGTEFQVATAEWVFARWFEPCCFGCQRLTLVFDTALIVGFGVECALAGWLMDCVLALKTRPIVR